MISHDTMKDMAKTVSVLVTFVGNRDPYPQNDDAPGPILSFLLQHPVDMVFMLCSSAAYHERAQDVIREAKDEGLVTKFETVDFYVSDVVDYGVIWDRLLKSLEEIRQRIYEYLPARLQVEWLFLLDSGTPQMKSCLFLAAAARKFPATLYQGIPPEFSGGAYKSRVVNIDPFSFVRSALVFDEQEEGKVSEPGVEEYKNSAGGNAPKYREAEERALHIAQYEDPVLLLGETGTGKTRIARQIHEASRRNGGPFVEVNCSAIPRDLAESELFGHVQGAFTGANKNRSGKIRAAQGGTLFLDEIGDLPLELQVKLLKVLEEHILYPVGSDEPVKVNIRLIAATHRDLEQMVKDGSFRKDLYQRLKVVVIRLPPLRERKEDILPLAQYFLDERNRKYGENKELSEAVKSSLLEYSWPGNVRELRNTIDSACSISQKDLINLDVLPEELQTNALTASGLQGLSGFMQGDILPQEGLDLRARLLQMEWSYVAAALRRTGGNREAAAKLLGMTGHAFRKALRERLAGFIENEWEGE